MKKLLRSCALAAGIGLGAASAPAAIVVTFSPSSQHVNIGETVLIDVSISGLDAEILSAFDLNFQYSTSILSWILTNTASVEDQLGTGYGAPPLLVFDSTANGDIGIQASALEDDATVAANQLNSFLMFSFELKGEADGVTTFGLGSDPDFERNFVGLDAMTLDVIVGNACVAVGTGQCQVPEPASWSLLALGLAGALVPPALRRRRQRL